MYNGLTKKLLLLCIIHCTQLPQEIAKGPDLPQAKCTLKG